jgi:hypothetical protein
MELSLTSGPVAAKGGISPLTGYERWVADVAYLSPDRLAAVDPDDNVCGAPDLVIEVLSPSNTVAEMNDRERICLENGAQEFGSGFQEPASEDFNAGRAHHYVAIGPRDSVAAIRRRPRGR